MIYFLSFNKVKYRKVWRELIENTLEEGGEGMVNFKHRVKEGLEKVKVEMDRVGLSENHDLDKLQSHQEVVL